MRLSKAPTHPREDLQKQLKSFRRSEWVELLLCFERVQNLNHWNSERAHRSVCQVAAALRVRKSFPSGLPQIHFPRVVLCVFAYQPARILMRPTQCRKQNDNKVAAGVQSVSILLFCGATKYVYVRGRVISRTVITHRLRAAATKLIMMLQPKTQDGKGRKESLHLILHRAALRLIIDLRVAGGVIRRLIILACWRAVCIFMRPRSPSATTVLETQNS